MLNFLCCTAISTVEDEDECGLHVAFLVQSEGFGVQEPPPSEALKAETLFSKIGENDPRIPDVLVVTSHSIWEMVLR